MTESAVITETDSHLVNAQGLHPVPNQQQLAWLDIKQGLKKWRIWLMLAYQDVRLRYRRSVLGPFWISISMAITTYSMGYLYGHLFHTDLQTYFPYLVSGMLCWSLLATQITDLTDGFSESERLIKQIKLPLSLYIHRITTRNIIIFFHNLIVLVPVLAIFHQVATVNFYTLLFIPGLLFIYVNSILLGLALAMIGARYRDLAQIIKSLIQVAFFLTPVIWDPAILPSKDQIFVVLNPFYAFMELVRNPLLGKLPDLSAFIVAMVITGLSLILCFNLFAKYRSRVVYWL